MKPDSDLDPISARLRSEEHRLRRRITGLTLIPIAVGAILIWVTGLRVSSAQKELDVLQDSLGWVEHTLDSARYELLAHLETLARKRQEADSLDALVNTYMAWIEERDPRAATRILEQAIEKYQSERVTPRIYLQILDEAQRDRARRVASMLEASGFNVPGIERMSRGPDTSELRYFRPEDADVAQQIQLLAAEQGTPLKLKDLSAAYGDAATVRSGHFEIWFGRDFAP